MNENISPAQQQGPSMSHKKIIIAGIAGFVLGVGALWYFDIIGLDFFRAPAAQLSPTPTNLPNASVLSAQCLGGSDPRVVLSWNQSRDMQTNGLLRTPLGGQPESLFGEDGPSFSTFTYTDSEVQSGATYEYEVVTGIGKRSNLVKVSIDPASCTP